MRDYLLGLFILVLAATYLIMTYRLPVEDIGDPIGPRFFPFLVGIGLAISGVLVVAETVKRAPGYPNPRHSSARPALVGRGVVVAGVIVWTFVYFSMFEWLGFALSCLVFLLGFLAFFNPGRWLINSAIAVCFSFGIYLTFTRFLGIKLPPGPLPY